MFKEVLNKNLPFTILPQLNQNKRSFLSLPSLVLLFKENRIPLNEQKVRLDDKKGLYFQKTEKIRPILRYNQKFFDSQE